MNDALIIQRPAEAARSLVLLFHGVGAGPQDMRAVGTAIARAAPHACVISVRAPDSSDFGSGWQWFSVRGVDEANRPARVADAMPGFLQTVRHWQEASGVSAEQTTLLGFSQGAIMALESSQQPVAPAASVIAIAGRYARTPRFAPPHMALRFLHGERDPVINCASSVDAVAALVALGADAQVELFPELGHSIDQRMVDAVVRLLREGFSASH